MDGGTMTGFTMRQGPLSDAEACSRCSASPDRPPICSACPLRAEIFENRQQAGYWRWHFQRAREKAEKLQQDLDRAEAKIKELKRQLFGRRSEKGGGATKRDGAGSEPAKRPRKRGQQPGRPGPRRRDTSHLPTREENYTLSGTAGRCPHCGLGFEPCLGSEDSEVIEIEVQAYKRRIRRQRYRSTCECDGLAGILTAPGPPKLIPKGRYGISLWVSILLDKYGFLRPTHRLLDDLRTHGIDLSMGTVTGGLKRLAPLFEPIREGLIQKNLEQTLWLSDGTGWRMFIPEEKDNWKWSLWVFQSRSAVVLVLDPTHKAQVPEQYFAGVEQGVLIVDRHSSYKAMAQVKAGKILLAFCWAHVRRDFLRVAENWTEHRDWGLSWVEAIGHLYHLNDLRLQAGHEQYAEHHQALKDAVEAIETRRDEELNEANLHPVRRKPLKSLGNHWQGLTRFVDHPQIPMDNNQAERTLRDPVCSRKQFFGSYALWSGYLAATLFSLFATLELWAINPRKWLTAYLQACAQAGGQAPRDAARWLPWNLPLPERTAMAELPPIDDTS